MFEPANYGGGFLLLAAAGLMLISAALPAPALGAEPGDYRGTFRVEDLLRPRLRETAQYNR